MELAHDILHFRRELRAPVERVWAAYADIDRRGEWSVPDGEAIVYDDADFAAGGTDHYRCGPPGDLSNVGEHHYFVVDERRALVYSDVVRRAGELMAVAVVTWQFESDGDSTVVSVVDEVTSLVGQEMIDGHRNGHTMTLDQLADWLARHDT